MLNFRLGLGAIALLALLTSCGEPPKSADPISTNTPAASVASSPSPSSSPSSDQSSLYLGKLKSFQLYPDKPTMITVRLSPRDMMVFEPGNKDVIYTIANAKGEILRDAAGGKIAKQQGKIIFTAPDFGDYYIWVSTDKPVAIVASIKELP